VKGASVPDPKQIYDSYRVMVDFVGSFCRPCLPLATGPPGPFDPIKDEKHENLKIPASMPRS
jgi:hypothetical protein